VAPGSTLELVTEPELVAETEALGIETALELVAEPSAELVVSIDELTLGAETALELVTEPCAELVTETDVLKPVVGYRGVAVG
jgi:hypothetical protein